MNVLINTSAVVTQRLAVLLNYAIYFSSIYEARERRSSGDEFAVIAKQGDCFFFLDFFRMILWCKFSNVMNAGVHRFTVYIETLRSCARVALTIAYESK